MITFIPNIYLFTTEEINDILKNESINWITMTLSLFVTGIGLTTNARIQQFAVNANVYTVYKSGFLSFYVFKITFGKSYVFKITLSFYVFKITLSFYVFKITLSFYVFKITFGKSYVVTKTKNRIKF